MNYQTDKSRAATVYVSFELAWALRTIGEAIQGDGPMRPETTSDGVAESLLREGIELNYPGLLDTYRKRAQIDAEGVKLAIAMLEKEGSAAA